MSVWGTDCQLHAQNHCHCPTNCPTHHFFPTVFLPPSFPPLRLEGEAAKGSEALLAASQEREATLAASLQELRGAMGDLADEAADREDALRRQVGSECGGSVGGGLQAEGGGAEEASVCVGGGGAAGRRCERGAEVAGWGSYLPTWGGPPSVPPTPLAKDAIYPPREVRPPSPHTPS